MVYNDLKLSPKVLIKNIADVIITITFSFCYPINSKYPAHIQ